MSVALPELPDDRRAQHPRHGRSDEPSGWAQPGAPGQPPGVSDNRPRLPSTPWPVGGAAPRHGGSNGHAVNGHGVNGHGLNGQQGLRDDGPTAGGQQNGGGPTALSGWDIARHAGGVLPGGGHGVDGSSAGGTHSGPTVSDDGRNGRHASGAFPVGPADAPRNGRAQQAGDQPSGRQTPWRAPDGPHGPAAHGVPAPGQQHTGGYPVPPGEPPGVHGRQQSGSFPAPPVDSPSGQRRIHSDVPPPRRSGRPAEGPPHGARPDAPPPHTPGPAAPNVRPTEPAGPETRQMGAWPAAAVPGPAAFDDQPTVPHGRATDVPDGDPDEGPTGFPGRHRRRAGASPDARPASTYREEAEAASGRKSRGGRRRRSAFWKELPILVVVALLLTFLIQTFIAKVYVIPSGSMETTLHGCTGCQNDRVLVDKITYRFSDPHPGDVVVFRGPDGWTSEFTAEEPGNVVVRALQGLGSLIGLAPPDEKDFIKRVIAVGGQTVQCCDSRNRVLVDGKPLDEPYIYFLPEAGTARQDSFGPVTVPAGELWMMGDSRNNSADSRVPGHGPVPISNVIGRARFIVLPFSRLGEIPSPNPQATPAALGGGDAGAPVALGMVGLVPLVMLRRRDRELGEFLPRRRT